MVPAVIARHQLSHDPSTPARRRLGPPVGMTAKGEGKPKTQVKNRTWGTQNQEEADPRPTCRFGPWGTRRERRWHESQRCNGRPKTHTQTRRAGHPAVVQGMSTGPDGSYSRGLALEGCGFAARRRVDPLTINSGCSTTVSGLGGSLEFRIARVTRAASSPICRLC